MNEGASTVKRWGWTIAEARAPCCGLTRSRSERARSNGTKASNVESVQVRPAGRTKKKGATLPWRLKEVLAIPRAVLEPERRYFGTEISVGVIRRTEPRIAPDAPFRNQIPFFPFPLTKSR